MDRTRFKKLALFTSVASLYGAGALVAGQVEGEGLLQLIPLRCPIHFLTGLSCPTCGLAHSLLSSFRGEFGKAWSQQPLGPITLASLPLLLLLSQNSWRRLEQALHRGSTPLMVSLLLYALFRAA